MKRKKHHCHTAAVQLVKKLACGDFFDDFAPFA